MIATDPALRSLGLGSDHDLDPGLRQPSQNPNGVDFKIPDGIVPVRDIHDTQVARHHGNERARTRECDVSAARLDSDLHMSPSVSSKLLAVAVRTHKLPENSRDRLRRWQIEIRVRPEMNTSQEITVNSTVTHLTTSAAQGTIGPENPLERESWVLLMAKHVCL